MEETKRKRTTGANKKEREKKTKVEKLKRKRTTGA